MKFDNPKTGEECLGVPERSTILLGLWDLQNYEFGSVFVGENFMKTKRIISQVDFFSPIRSSLRILGVLTVFKRISERYEQRAPEEPPPREGLIRISF